MPVFRPLTSMRRHFAPLKFPFERVRIYDDVPATGRLLAEFDVSNAATQQLGSSQVLNDTVSTTVLLDGFPAYARFCSADGLTVTGDQQVLVAASITNANQQVVRDTAPDDALNLLYPGPWQAGTPVAFGPGDITYQP